MKLWDIFKLGWNRPVPGRYYKEDERPRVTVSKQGVMQVSPKEIFESKAGQEAIRKTAALEASEPEGGIMSDPCKCPVCDGSGKVRRPMDIKLGGYTMPSDFTYTHDCEACGGRGVLWPPQNENPKPEGGEDPVSGDDISVPVAPALASEQDDAGAGKRLTTHELRDYILRAHGMATGRYVQSDTEMRRRIGKMLDAVIDADDTMRGFLGRGGPEAHRDAITGTGELADDAGAELRNCPEHPDGHVSRSWHGSYWERWCANCGLELAGEGGDAGAELPPLEEIPGKPLSEMIIEERHAVDELDRLRAEKERLHDQLDQRLSHVEALEAAYEELREEWSSARAENERLRRVNEELKQTMQQVHCDEATQSGRVQILSWRLDELEEGLRELLVAVDKLAAYVPPNKWPAAVRDRARKLLEEQES